MQKSAQAQEVAARHLRSPGHQSFNLTPAQINKTGKKKATKTARKPAY